MRTHVRAISFAISAVPLAAAAVTRRMAQSGADWRAGASRPRQSTTDLEAGRPRPWRSGFTNDRFGHDVMNREGHEERHCFAIFVFVVVQTLFASSAFAQDWIEYRDTVDRFGVDMPKPPTIQEITYTSWRGRNMPARIHVAQDGASRYSVTVINYASDPDVTDVLGSIAFAATNFRKRGGEVTFDAYQQVDRIPGHELHIRNGDGSITYVEINLFERRLYILEATVPRNAAPPLEFQMSLSILDAMGMEVGAGR